MLLETRQLGYRYPGSAMIRYPDTLLDAGSSLLVLGESGCGKSTLLYLLSGLLTPTEGTVHFGGKVFAAMGAASRDRERGRRIGLVFQQAHFVRSLSLWENWLAAAWCAGLKPDQVYLQQLAERLELSALLRRKAEALSAGELQRASIGRALVNRPGLLLADEPTSALDDRRCRAVLDLLQTEAAAAGAALLIVTHDARVRSSFDREILLSPLVVSRD